MSQAERTGSVSLYQSTEKYVKSRSDYIIERLPEPSEEWVWSDQVDHYSDRDSQVLYELREHDAIEMTRRDPGNPDRHCWRVVPEVYERALAVREHREAMMPCGHRGFENVKDGGYRCQYEFCDQEFTREEVQR